MKEIEEKEAEQIELLVKFGDQFNFNNLFRCKGKQGLFTLRSQVNKSGMVAIRGFMDYDNTATVKAIDLVCLGHLVFTRLAGNEPLRMNDVFTNIHEWEQKEGANISECFETMETLVPNFDEDHFKPYHASRVIEWYNIITKKLKELNDEPIVEENKG